MHHISIASPFTLKNIPTQKNMSFLVSARMRGVVFIFSSIMIPGWHQSGQLDAGQGHRIGAASGEEAVNSPLMQRLWLPETLAQNPQMKAKPVMTNKLGRTTRRWNLQMCSLSASRHKSRCGAQIELHYSFAQQHQGSLFIGAGQGRRTKDPLYELCACTCTADARQGEIYTPQWLLKASIREQTSQISTILSSLHCTPP